MRYPFVVIGASLFFPLLYGDDLQFFANKKMNYETTPTPVSTPTVLPAKLRKQEEQKKVSLQERPTQHAAQGERFFLPTGGSFEVLRVRGLTQAEIEGLDSKAKKCAGLRLVEIRPSKEIREILFSKSGLSKEQAEQMPDVIGWLFSERCFNRASTDPLRLIDERILQFMKKGG